MEGLNNCQTHNKPIIMYCLEKGCQTPKLCKQCIRNHDTHNKKFYFLEELSELITDILTKNEKIEDLRTSVKKKDVFLTQKIPEIVKTLKKELDNFVKEVEKTITETGNRQFGSVPLFLQDDSKFNNPEELLKSYHGLSALIEDGDQKIENIESDLKLWEEKCFETIEWISEELEKTIPKFGLIKKALKKKKKNESDSDSDSDFHRPKKIIIKGKY